MKDLLTKVQVFARRVTSSKAWRVVCTIAAAFLSLAAPRPLCHYVFPAAQAITGQWILYNNTVSVCTMVVFLLDCMLTYGLLLLAKVKYKWWFYIITGFLILLWVFFYVVVTRMFVLEDGNGW